MLVRDGGLTAWVFPAKSLSAWAKRGPDGQLSPSRASEALAANPRAEAVLDGAMFSLCAPGGYASSTCADLDYLLRGEGLFDDGEHLADGGTVSVTPQGTAVVRPGADAVPGARLSVQLYPTLVRDGQVIVSNNGTNADRVWRAALCVLDDGRLAFAIMQADMQTFARTLIAALRARHAYYTDGGGSTSLAVRGDARYGHPEDRRVAFWLVANAPENEERLTPRSVAKTALLAAALGGATFWVVREFMRR